MATVTPPSAVWTGHPQRRTSDVPSARSAGAGTQRLGAFVFRYGLALIFIWIGLLKFAGYEAKNIEPLVANSPLFAGAYQSLGLTGLAALIGVIEIVIGVLIAMRPFAPRMSALGSLGAIVTFLITLSFMFTTPGVWEPGVGVPALSALPGQFLAKDLVLLGVSIWTAGEAMHAARVSQAAGSGNATGSAAGSSAFKDVNIEIRETREAPVVAKSARVVEEVSVGRKATDRSATVHDTVRRSGVDIDVDPATTYRGVERRSGP